MKNEITQIPIQSINISKTAKANPSQNLSAVRSKKTITETLLYLMAKYPYTEITVKHILLEADVSRKTFYRNFSSKDDVLNSYIGAILHKNVEVN